MFDSIMKIQLSQVKGVFSITLIQHVGGKVGDEEADRGCEVVSYANFGTHFFEWDIFSISRKDAYVNSQDVIIIKSRVHWRTLQTMVSHCVQSRTGTSTISIFGGNELWPLAICPRMSLWSNMIYLATRRNQIEQEKPEIPNEDSNGLENPGNSRYNEHGSWNVEGQEEQGHYIVS
jgi:hypothetical protein